uniref:RRM domain-containing protein n=1 Tax=Eutreptiella gymnastica TaxID=73025 RepID=A0A7S4CT24_9EUGL
MTGKSKGIGLVRFSSVGEARRAKESLHGMSLQPNTPLEVKYAENDKDRSLRIARRRHPDEPEAVQSAQATKKTQDSKDTPKVVPNDKSSEHSTTNSETDLDSDAIFSALAKYAKLMTDPMDSLLEGEESSPVHTLLKTAPVASMAPVASIEEATSISPSDETNETAPDTCGHSMGSNDSGRVSPHHDTKKPTEEIEKPAQDVEKPVQIPEETCERVVRSNMKPSKLRADAPPFVPAAAKAKTAAESTILIKGLQLTCDQVVVYKLCAPHGAIAKVDLTKDSASKTTTASVQFRNPADAQKAYSKLNGTKVQKCTLSVSF